MIGGLNKAAQYSAILERDKKYDGIFYFVVKNNNVYCRPSCPLPHLSRKHYSFFDTTLEAKLQGYKPCKRCLPSRLKHDLSVEILTSIDAGAINDKGVHGLAESFHISERHLRRIVQDRTGTSPTRLNKAKRLYAAELLITQTKLSIIDIAFITEFSSLRQFNDSFKGTFKTSPREMRKTTLLAPQKRSIDPIVLPLKLSYAALSRVPLHHQLNKQGRI